jgi:hypothetical protein
MCCPNFISAGVTRCENCNAPAGDLFDCPVCGTELLEGETYCDRCYSYISKDGTRGSSSSWDVSEDREFDDDDDLEEFEHEVEDDYSADFSNERTYSASVFVTPPAPGQVKTHGCAPVTISLLAAFLSCAWWVPNGSSGLWIMLSVAAVIYVGFRLVTK